MKCPGLNNRVGATVPGAASIPAELRTTLCSVLDVSSYAKGDSAILLLTGTACALRTTPAAIPLAVFLIGIAIPREGFPIFLRKLAFRACFISHGILLSFQQCIKTLLPNT